MEREKRFELTDEIIQRTREDAENYIKLIEKDIPNTPCRDGLCNMPVLYQDLSTEELHGALRLMARIYAGRVSTLHDNLQFRQIIYHLVEEKVKREHYAVLSDTGLEELGGK